MKATIRKLFGGACALALVSVSAYYYGSRIAATEKAQQANNAIASHFATDPGDGWMLFGIFLLVVALAVALAGAMLAVQERRAEG